MSTSKSNPTSSPPEEIINQQAGDRSTQIGKVMGDLKITYVAPGILVVAVVLIAFVLFSGVNAPVLLGLIAPSPTITPSSTPTLIPTQTPTSTLTPIPTQTPIPTATISLTKTPLAPSPVPCRSCGQVKFAVATPIESRDIKPAKVLVLRQFALDTTVSSYTFSEYDNTYEADFYRMDWMRTHGCLPEAENFLPRIKSALQNRARQLGQEDLLPYIQTEEQIRTLGMERPEVANELMPITSEWQEMSLTEYEVMSQWQLNCIGIPWPAWNITIENTSDQEQVITKVIYRTYEIDYVLGGEYGLVSPEVTYVHQIDWIKGDQEAQLVPTFKIPPRSSGSFELQLTTAYPDWGRRWNMQIFFVIDGERGAVSTETFNLIMSGLPVPGGGFK
jgi:hypothetical protein